MKIRQFFQEKTGEYSSSRLLAICSFPPATYIVLSDYSQLPIYLGAYAGLYGVNKLSGIKSVVREKIRWD